MLTVLYNISFTNTCVLFHIGDNSATLSKFSTALVHHQSCCLLTYSSHAICSYTISFIYLKLSSLRCITHVIGCDGVILFSSLNRYAAAPQELRTDWDKFTKDYFLNRSSLVSVFLLIDASIPAKKIDLEYASWLGQNQVKVFLYIFSFLSNSSEKKKKREEIQNDVNLDRLSLQHIVNFNHLIFNLFICCFLIIFLSFKCLMDDRSLEILVSNLVFLFQA